MQVVPRIRARLLTLTAETEKLPNDDLEASVKRTSSERTIQLGPFAWAGKVSSLCMQI
jgi:hypothetical protein